MREDVLMEKVILQRLREGDPEAFKAIYDQYWHRLYKLATEKLPSEENAEEIIQDIFVDIWERRKTIVLSGDLEHYLFKALKYKILDFIRAQIVRRKHEDSVLKFSADYFDSPEIEEEMAYQELMGALHTALDALPEKTQNIFRLSRIEQLSSREISGLLNIPERTINHHLSQAVGVLRVNLKEYAVFSVLLTHYLY